MAQLPLIIAPDPRLKVRSEPVETVDEEVRCLMDDMLETMYEAEGIGLAAIQVGVRLRVIVADVHGEDEPPSPTRLINPEIVWSSDKTAVYEEGCLSLPDQYADVERPARVKIRYLDRDGEPSEMEAQGRLGTCLQHEIDHLEGILFVDHLTLVKRNIILRKLRKARRSKVAASA